MTSNWKQSTQKLFKLLIQKLLKHVFVAPASPGRFFFNICWNIRRYPPGFQILINYWKDARPVRDSALNKAFISGINVLLSLLLFIFILLLLLLLYTIYYILYIIYYILCIIIYILYITYYILYDIIEYIILYTIIY